MVFVFYLFYYLCRYIRDMYGSPSTCTIVRNCHLRGRSICC